MALMQEVVSVLGGDSDLEARPRCHAGRILMTLARTTTSTDSEITDCIAMSALARPTSGSVSVGLKASALVNAR